MKWLIIFSTWVENNSGQIQILIALGAIVLAVMAYTKVLEQIEIANKQEREAEEQRFCELKLQLIKAVNQEIQSIQMLGSSYLNHQGIMLLYLDGLEIVDLRLLREINDFFPKIKKSESNLCHINEKLNFLEDTYYQINNPELKIEHIEKILNKVFESDLIVDEIRADVEKMRSLIDAIQYFGKKKSFIQRLKILTKPQ